MVPPMKTFNNVWKKTSTISFHRRWLNCNPATLGTEWMEKATALFAKTVFPSPFYALCKPPALKMLSVMQSASAGIQTPSAALPGQ